MNDRLRLDASLPIHVSEPPAAAEPPLDPDPQETTEWVESLAAVVREEGPARARLLLDALQRHASRAGLRWTPSLNSPYVNTIAVADQARFPGDVEHRRGIFADRIKHYWFLKGRRSLAKVFD
jgi:pyruvate dehydrogenase E1 component